MKNFVKIFAILTATTFLIACSTIFDRSSVNVKKLIWLERDGIFDPEVPNSEVHAILTKGLNHKNPEIVACSISAIFWYVSISDTAAVMGNPRPIDRQLTEIPGIYDLFIGLWDEGWTESGGIVPDSEPSADAFWDRVMNKTDCIVSDGDPVWVSLLGPLVYMFPGDEKVHEILWKQMPQMNPDGLIRELREGKFDTPKGEQYRIDILTNPETKAITATLAAESLGVFRTDDGLDALVSVLQKDIHEHVPTKLTIVASIMKYKEDGVPHIALMRQTLDGVPTDDAEDRKRKEALQERLAWFEEDYADEIGVPSD